MDLKELRDFPDGTSGKEPTRQCRRHKRCRFDPWVGKIPWRRAGQRTPFLPGESHRGAGRLQSIGSQRVRYNWSDLALKHRVKRNSKFFCYSQTVFSWRQLTHPNLSNAFSPLQHTETNRTVGFHLIGAREYIYKYDHNPVHRTQDCHILS